MALPLIGFAARKIFQDLAQERLRELARHELRREFRNSMRDLGQVASRPPTLSVHIDTSKLTRDLQLWQREVVPRAMAEALNQTAGVIQRELQGEMGRVFDRPTRFTLNSTFIKRATPQNLEARIRIKDEAMKSGAAIRWLGPQIYGGARDAKRSEHLLRQQGILGGDEFIVPGAGARLDAHGNMSRGQMQQILSRVGASFDALTRAPGKVSRARGQAYKETYFYLRDPRGRLTRRGIYRRIVFPGTGLTKVEPVLIFVKRPRYRRRLRFFDIVDQVFQTRYPLQLKYELERAIQAAAARHIV